MTVPTTVRSPPSHAHIVSKYALTYAILIGAMDKVRATGDRKALKKLERDAAQLDAELERDGIAFYEVEACYREAYRRLYELR